MTEKQFRNFLTNYCSKSALKWDGSYRFYIADKAHGRNLKYRLQLTIPIDAIKPFIKLLGKDYIREDRGVTVALLDGCVRIWDINYILNYYGIDAQKVCSMEDERHWIL